MKVNFGKEQDIVRYTRIHFDVIPVLEYIVGRGYRNTPLINVGVSFSAAALQADPNQWHGIETLFLSI